MSLWPFNFIHLIVIVLTYFLTLILISKVLREGRAPGSTIAWLLIILLLPFIGIPLYLFLGGRKVKRIAKKKTPLYAGPPPSPLPENGPSLARIMNFSGLPSKTLNNYFKPLPTGEETYDYIINSLQKAQYSIHIATYILGNDSVGRAILELLCEKAQSGVEVKLLLDGVGSFWFPRYRLNKLRKAQGEYAFFVPLVHIPFSAHSNLRNHRKMILIDGREAILGGMNLAQEYMGINSNPQRWVDFSFSICGEALKDLENIFSSDWSFASATPRHPTPTQSSGHDFAREFEQRPTPIQIIASGPDVMGEPLYDILLTEIFTAKKRIGIATPYFIPDESLTRALILACRRGVEVQIVVPARSNHLIADLCRTSYLRQIRLAGGSIRYYVPRMLHTKMTLIDDSLALIGSANMDIRSLFYNYEVGVLLSSQEELKSITEQFDSLLKSTRPASFREYWGSKLIEGIGRVIAPLL
jgi:cardiolipin synthase A/B